MQEETIIKIIGIICFCLALGLQGKAYFTNKKEATLKDVCICMIPIVLAVISYGFAF